MAKIEILIATRGLTLKTAVVRDKSWDSYSDLIRAGWNKKPN